MEPLLPDRTPKRGGRWRDYRQVIDVVAFKYRTGRPWMDLPGSTSPPPPLAVRRHLPALGCSTRSPPRSRPEETPRSGPHPPRNRLQALSKSVRTGCLTEHDQYHNRLPPGAAKSFKPANSR
ncbi:transposase [Streptomyces xanthophaeus]